MPCYLSDKYLGVGNITALNFLFIEINDDDFMEVFYFPERGKGKNVTLMSNLGSINFTFSTLKTVLFQ